MACASRVFAPSGGSIVSVQGSWLVAATVLPLLVLGLTPSGWANRHGFLLRLAASVASVFSFLGAVCVALFVGIRGPIDAQFLSGLGAIPCSLGVFVDGVAAVMLVLITFLGALTTRFALRYLEGEPTQGRFLRWMAFTIGAVLALVASCNLVMFTAAWMLTSFGLHQLLTHYPERSWAIWTARKKFLISRLGDALLIGALGLTYWCFGSFEYRAIFAAAETLHAEESPGGWLVSAIGILFVLGAMTKSAQFPFHSWLPDTMETPTPVSALMHAGVINAGGFLVIRLSPLISLSPVALDLLALVGAGTALFGGVVMLTQPSIKRALAYSTIAQMGFMMLQCGLGAFTAALLHIAAHSAYKAHAFLSCGSVLESAARFRSDSPPMMSPVRRLQALPIAVAIACGLCAGAFWLSGAHAPGQPGTAVLGMVLAIALTHLLWSGISSGSVNLGVWAMASGAAVSGTYALAYRLLDQIVAASAVQHATTTTGLHVAVVGVVAAGFLGAFALQSSLARVSRHPWFQAAYVHALNGFYIDIPARRLTAWFYRQSAPVQ